MRCASRPIIHDTHLLPLPSPAPGYLQPSAQEHLLEPPSDCLEVIEKSVNWEAEKLYGVEGRWLTSFGRFLRDFNLATCQACILCDTLLP